MRELVLEQLKRCQWADTSQFNYDTMSGIIKKYKKPEYVVGQCYLLQLAGSMLNNTTSAVAVNWNNSTAPNYGTVKAYVSNVVGQMVFIDTIAFDKTTGRDLPNVWSGWVNAADITLLSAL